MTTAIETRVDTVPGMLDAALAARPEAYAVRDVHGRPARASAPATGWWPGWATAASSSP